MTRHGSKSDRQRVAVGYLRRSTDQQEQSIPDQRRAIERYAAQHGLQLVRFHVDDSITGTRTKGRKAFLAMMAAAQRHDCDFGVVIVYDIKRFGRVDNDEAGHYRYVLRSHGVDVRYVSEHFTGHSSDDLLRAVKQWQAREESKDLSKVTIRGLLSKVASTQASGCWMGGVPPYGYDLRYEKPSGAFVFYVRYMPDRTKQLFDAHWHLIRTLGPDETPALSKRDRCRLVLGCRDRIETVREIYRLFLEERRGFAAIADRLNRLKISTIRSKSWSSQCGGRWTDSVIRQILTNPAYSGDLAWNRRTHGKIHQISGGEAVDRPDALIRKWRYNDELDWIVVRGIHPPIVSRNVWERANWLIRKRVESRQRGEYADTSEAHLVRSRAHWRGPSSRFLLSGLLTCAHCGASYEGRVIPPKNRPASGDVQYEYVCGGRLRGKTKCKEGAIPQNMLEQSVISAVARFYSRYLGSVGRDRCLEAIRGRVDLEQRSVAAIACELRSKVDALDRTPLSPGQATSSESPARTCPNTAVGARKRALLERWIEALNYISLSEPEIPELLIKLRAFVARLHESLQSDDTDVRLAAIRRCVVGIAIDNTGGRAQIDLREVPTVLSALDPGPTLRVATEFRPHGSDPRGPSTP